MKNRFGTWGGYLITAFGTIIIVLLMFQVRSFLNPTTISLVLLIAVLFSATIFGSRRALISSLIGGLSFNFLFLPPYYTFTISEPQNWVALTVFLLTAITAGQLSSYAKKRAEESEQKQIEIERLFKELQSAFEKASQAEALKQSERLKSSLLDAVTHDLRTPLTSIKASVTTLLGDRKMEVLDKEGTREFLEIIDEETDRLNEFIERMVGLAKIEANALIIRKQLVNIEEIINIAIERARKQLRLHKVRINIDDDLGELNIDGVLISEVVYILLENAAKYSRKETTIRISVKTVSDGFISVSVEDQGAGIEDDLREKVFTKFYRVQQDNIHTTSSGLGLGLAIAKGIVESQGGKIWTENGSSGFSTKFVFTVSTAVD